MQIHMAKVAKLFFTRYYPIIILLAIANVSIVNEMGFNPWRLDVWTIIFMYNIQNLICYVFVYMILSNLRPRRFIFRIIDAYAGVVIGLIVFRIMMILPVRFQWLQPPTSLSDSSILMQLFLFDLYNGAVLIFFYFIAERSYLTEERYLAEQMDRISSEKKVLEHKLKLLQAQIEPHFLFNTLTAIVDSYDRDLKKGKTMLLNFIQYLRASLMKTRTKTNTIEQELEIIKSYLDIFKIRMGRRLTYSIDVPSDIKELQFPSMLIQPIVENAIKHGLEPKVDGGHISIRIRAVDGMLQWEIADTGLGLSENGSHEEGFGLAIIEKRIDSLFGPEGKLVFEENQPCGVKVILEVPCD